MSSNIEKIKLITFFAALILGSCGEKSAEMKFPWYQGELLDAPYYTVNKHLGYYAAEKNPHYFERNQLFDLVNDPHELVNIYDSKPDTALFIRNKLQKSLKSFPGRPYGELTGNISSNPDISATETKLYIFPNPSNGCFTVRLPEYFQNGIYRVFSLLGSLIRNGSYAKDQIELDLMNIPGGCYIINVSNSKMQLSDRFIIN